MTDAPVSFFSSGPPETILPDESVEATAALSEAADDPVAHIGEVCKRRPGSLEAWAALGEALEGRERDSALAYAAFRTGYHRGLDRLRASGWRGSGYVRWAHPSNRGFLRALWGLERIAWAIGETEEAERCALFLVQLDPDWPPGHRGY